jgi:hypothetical protein
MNAPNVRITNRHREDGGRWMIDPADTSRLAYIHALLKDLIREEPANDWHLETCGTVADWHRWNEAAPTLPTRTNHAR